MGLSGNMIKLSRELINDLDKFIGSHILLQRDDFQDVFTITSGFKWSELHGYHKCDTALHEPDSYGRTTSHWPDFAAIAWAKEGRAYILTDEEYNLYII
jgi:hypothetical protein